MRFLDTSIRGAQVIELAPFQDERGSFARLHCEREFEQRGLPRQMVQTSLSITRGRGTLRGLHFQAAPSREGKLVRCVRGTVFDVVVDLRPSSPTYREYFAQELNDRTYVALFIPAGCAHGFETLTDEAAVLYQMTDFYQPELSRGVRWNDPAFGIRWPLVPTALNERDRTYPDFTDDLVRGFADDYVGAIL